MGTSGEGLYDNDEALDVLADLLDGIPLEKDPAHLAAGVGLLLWFQGAAFATDPKKFRKLLARHGDWIAAFPSPVRSVLEAIAADPETAAAGARSRPAVLKEILGGYCDGPRRDELLTVAGGAEVIGELARRCRDHLSGALRRTLDLYELAGYLAPLGVLLELGTLAPPTEPDLIATWEAGFDRADAGTEDERDFWDEYAARVKKAFVLLRAG